MTEDNVRKQAFAMPLCSPAYPCGPYLLSDLTLGLGTVVYDYLERRKETA